MPLASIGTSAFTIPPMTEAKVENGWSDAQADLRRMFEENGSPMWVHDGLKVVAVNRAALLHYGYSQDDFLALTVGDLAVTEEPRGSSKHRRKDRSLIDVEVTSFAVTFRGLPASLDSIQDVTVPSKDRSPGRLSRPLAGDRSRCCGHERRKPHPDGVECRRRGHLWKTGGRGAWAASRARISDELPRR